MEATRASRFVQLALESVPLSRIDSHIMEEESRDGRLRADAQKRGLILLIGGALLAAGLAEFVGRLPTSSPPAAPVFAFDEVDVLAPAYVVRGPVDVNIASAGDLERLPGIGAVLAARIVAEREERGPFATIDDMARVNGIGPATIDGFRDRAIAGDQ